MLWGRGGPNSGLFSCDGWQIRDHRGSMKVSNQGPQLTNLERFCNLVYLFGIFRFLVISRFPFPFSFFFLGTGPLSIIHDPQVSVRWGLKKSGKTCFFIWGCRLHLPFQEEKRKKKREKEDVFIGCGPLARLG